MAPTPIDDADSPVRVPGSTLELVPIGPGEFVMGSRNRHFSENPPHRVCIPRGFWLAKYPVTQAQWVAVVGANPSAVHNLPDQPVEGVRWDQAVAFCMRLNAHSGYLVRLPSEAEWEYACRAGSTDDFFFHRSGPFLDDSQVPAHLQRALCEDVWFDLNSGGRTRSVGAKRSNPWGLHDLLGNVWEWCADVWHGDDEGPPVDGSPWLDRMDAPPRRCLRGGAWDMNAFRCRSPYRSFDHRGVATDRFGLRVVVDVGWVAGSVRGSARESGQA